MRFMQNSNENTMDGVRPVVVISRCLGFDACRWNQAMIPSEVVRLLRPHVEVLTPCPEVEIGLGVPREPIRIIEEQGRRILYQPAREREVTGEMEKYTAGYLQGLETVDGFILKSKSPSCGIREVNIYPRRGKVAVSKRDSGFFGGAVLQKYPDLPVETDGRLLNFAIREHFFTFLYTRARFRWLQQHPTMGGLVEFHARHKYIFLANHQQVMRKMGRLVANPEKESLERILVQYEALMGEAFRQRPRFSSHINVLEHALGYVSDRIGSEEKRYFLNLLEDYRTGRFPLSALLTVIKSWLIRFNVTYLRNQFYFQPFPGDLVEITDSGKGRKMKS